MALIVVAILVTGMAPAGIGAGTDGHATGAVWLWRMNGATITAVTPVSTVADVGYQIAYPQ